MVKVMLNVLLIIVFAGVFTLTAFAESKYVGATNCKMCHSSKKSGEAYKIWEASAHAKAYATLASEESKKIATEKGIEHTLVPSQTDAPVLSRFSDTFPYPHILHLGSTGGKEISQFQKLELST